MAVTNKISLKEVESELETLKMEDAEMLKKLEKESLVDKELMKKSVKLLSSDQVEFVVEARVAFQSDMIQNAIEDCDDREHDPIYLGNVTAEIFEKILKYCRKHSEKGVLDKNLEEFDNEFLDVDTDLLYDLLMASNYLSIKELVVKICKKTARLMKGKTVEEIRELFGIENDFPPGKEEEIRSENRWAFEPKKEFNFNNGASGSGSTAEDDKEDEDDDEEEEDDSGKEEDDKMKENDN